MVVLLSLFSRVIAVTMDIAKSVPTPFRHHAFLFLSVFVIRMSVSLILMGGKETTSRYLRFCD